METDLFGLVMTGGGARGAYQAGVMLRIAELYKERGPFQVIAGASAGAINGSMVAASQSQLLDGIKELVDLWSNLEPKSIFRTDPGALSSRAARWLTDLSLGGVFGGGKAQSLLDARPLYGLLREKVPFDRIKANVQNGALKALAVVATNYSSGKTYTFVQGQPGLGLWLKSRRVTLATEIRAEHILASAAIPVLFQPVKLSTERGDFFFGDGCLRLTSPLSPAIRLGANKLLAIGVKSKRNAMALIDAEPRALATSDELKKEPQAPPVAQVIGVILNAIFLDHLDTDVEHLERINEMLRKQNVDRIEGAEGLRKLQVLSITPSVDLGAVAKSHAAEVPRFLQYMLRGLGTNVAETADLLSYLLFIPGYTRELIAIGYKDAGDRIDEIKEFLANK
jgi:NTE family protein